VRTMTTKLGAFLRNSPFGCMFGAASYRRSPKNYPPRGAMLIFTSRECREER
jgi:hypothetical protein